MEESIMKDQLRSVTRALRDIEEENEELHGDVVKLKESEEMRRRRYAKELREMKERMEEMKMVEMQLRLEVKTEREMRRKEGESVKRKGNKGQKIEIGAYLEIQDQLEAGPSVDTTQIDMIKLADIRLDKETTQMKLEIGKRTVVEEQVEKLQQMVALRDGEIDRLKSKLEGSMIRRSSTKLDETLVLEIETLREEKLDLIKRLEKVELMASDLNRSLKEAELKEVKESKNAERKQIKVKEIKKFDIKTDPDYIKLQEDSKGLQREITSNIIDRSNDELAIKTLKGKISDLETVAVAMQQNIKNLEREKRQVAEELEELDYLVDQKIGSLERQIKEGEGKSIISKLERTISQYSSRIHDLESYRDSKESESTFGDAGLEIEKQRMHIRDIERDLRRSKEGESILRKEKERVEKVLDRKEKVILEQKGLLNNVDRERNRNQNEFNDKVGNMESLREENDEMKEKCEKLEEKVERQNEEIEDINSNLQRCTKELQALHEQMKESTQLSDHWQTQSNEMQNEGQRLAVDLVALTRENQSLNLELRDAMHEREGYMKELEVVSQHLDQSNANMKKSEEERLDLMRLYRSLIVKQEKLEIKYNHGCDEISELKVQLVGRDKRVLMTERELDQINNERNQYVIEHNARSKDQIDLTRALATSERVVKQGEVERQRLMREMQAARELCHSLDRSKDDLNCSLSQVTLDFEREAQECERLRNEVTGLESRVRTEGLRAKRLEEALTQERSRNIHNEKSDEGLRATKSEAEDRIKEMMEHQKIDLEITTAQLRDSREQMVIVETRVRQLERLLSQSRSETKVVEVKPTATNTVIQNLRYGLEKELSTATSNDSIASRTTAGTNDNTTDLVPDRRNAYEVITQIESRDMELDKDKNQSQ